MANTVTVVTNKFPFKFFNSDVGFLKQIVVVRDTSADIEILAAVAGKYAGLFGMEYNISSDHDLSLKSNTTEQTLLGTIRGVSQRIGPPFFSSKIGEALTINPSANVTHMVLWAAYFTYLSGR